MDSSASTSTEATPAAEPRRETTRPRHFHFRRRRVLWALGLDRSSTLDEAPQAVAN